MIRFTARAARGTLIMTTAMGLALAIPEFAIAQQAAPSASSASAAAAQLAAAKGTIEELVVTARKTAENEQNVPIAISTVTAQALKDLSVRDVIDIQKVAPGLQIASVGQSGRARLTIRGQTETDDHLTADRSVGVYIDGVNYDHDYGLRSSLIDIAQVEVLKGPQGTLFGKNTTGGALNITTQHPTYDLGGYIDALYGSYNNRQILGAANIPIVADKLSLRLVGQVIDRDGFGHTADGQPEGDDHNVAGRIQLRADPVDNVHILLSGDASRMRNHADTIIVTDDSMLNAAVAPSANTATGALGDIAKQLGLNPALAADRLTAYNAWLKYFNAYQNGSAYHSGFASSPAGMPFKDNLSQYGVSSNIAVDFAGITARSITSYRHLSRSIFQDFDVTPFDIYFPRQDSVDQNFSQELQLSSTGHGRLDWQAGLFYNKETGRDLGETDTFDYVQPKRPTVAEVIAKNSSRAAYAQAVYHLTDTWRVTAGARYTEDTRGVIAKNRTDESLAIPPLPPGGVPQCNLLAPAAGGPVFPNCVYSPPSKSFNHTTWLISTDWRPIEQMMVYGTISTGYRAGGFTQPGGGPYASVALLNANFTPFLPETVMNYETGFKSDLWDRRLRVNGSIYYSDYKNVQKTVREFDPINNVIANVIHNAGQATLYGGELEVTAAPTEHLIISAGTAYLHPKYNQFLTVDAAGNRVDMSGLPFSDPKWTYNLSAAYTVPLSDGSIRLYANYAWIDAVNFVPGTPDAASVTQSAYGLLDGRINWHIESQNIDVAIFGKNLTDKKYLNSAANAQAFGWNIGDPGDPRTYGVQVRKTF
jgi:iron complex outermembrane receptor protein